MLNQRIMRVILGPFLGHYLMCLILFSSVLANLLHVLVLFIGRIYLLGVFNGVQEVTLNDFCQKCLIHWYFQTPHFPWFLGCHRSKIVPIWVQIQEM